MMELKTRLYLSRSGHLGIETLHGFSLASCPAGEAAEIVRRVKAWPGLLAEHERTLGDLQVLANLLDAQQYDTALEVVHHAANRVSAILARAKGESDV